MSSKPLTNLRCNRLHCNGLPVLRMVRMTDGETEVRTFFVECPACLLRGRSFIATSGREVSLEEADRIAERRAVNDWKGM